MRATKRIIFIALGLILTALGVVGIVTPLLPTTPFLLAAGSLFLRASPRLHRWLQANRVTGSFLRAYTEGTGLSRGQKVATISLLWVTLLVSAWFLRSLWWALAILGTVGAGVTVHLLTMRPRRDPPARQQ